MADEDPDGGVVETVGELFTVGGSSGSGGAFSAPAVGLGGAGSARLSALPGVDAVDLPFASVFATAGAGSGGLESSGVATVFLFLSFFDLCSAVVFNALAEAPDVGATAALIVLFAES